jgi:hypothetical protein
VLVNASKNWRLRYREGYYRYRLEKHTTLTSYSYLGKQRRYGKAAWLPERVDFIKQSNSQTLRMCFDTRGAGLPAGPSVHIHSIHVDPARLEALESEGFLFGVKLSLSRRVLGVTRSLELFQSIDGGTRGCLDEGGVWVEGAAFFRHTYSLGRVKYYQSSGIVEDARIVNCDNLAKVKKPSQG